MNNEEFMIKIMREALISAEEAYTAGDVPVGAVIVKEGEIIARACNETRSLRMPTRHAEISVIERASLFLKNERLNGCDLYVTKEPCAMCAGAIVHARINRVIIGARDVKYGACGTVLDVCGNPLLNHIPEIFFGILEEDCAFILKKFFEERRNKNVR